MTPNTTRQYNIDAGIPSSVALLGCLRVSHADGPDTIESNFRIETNLELAPASEDMPPMMTMAFD